MRKLALGSAVLVPAALIATFAAAISGCELALDFERSNIDSGVSAVDASFFDAAPPADARAADAAADVDTDAAAADAAQDASADAAPDAATEAGDATAPSDAASDATADTAPDAPADAPADATDAADPDAGD